MEQLDKKNLIPIAQELNKLLANYQVFYVNIRGFHWNIKGTSFFVLHEKFEELYDNVAEKIDEIAERVLMLSQTPTHSFSEYLKVSMVKESTNISCGIEASKIIIKDLGILLSLERNILEVAGSLDDEGTVALMSDFIREQEKLVWMYSQYCAK